MMMLTADHSDDFALPKKAQIKEQQEPDNDLFLIQDALDDDRDARELDFDDLLMLPSLEDDDDLF